MKLNLVADYEIGGMHFCDIHSIDSSCNLAKLAEMTSANVPVLGGGWVRVRAKTLEMCESCSRAREIAYSWQRAYEAQGRRWDYITPFDVSETGMKVES